MLRICTRKNANSRIFTLGRDENFGALAGQNPERGSNIYTRFLLTICNQHVVGSNPTAGSSLAQAEDAVAFSQVTR